MHNNEWTSGPANYALVKFLITSLELSASSDRFFTSSYISFLYLEKFKIHELFSTHLVFRKDGGKDMPGTNDSDFDLWTITLLSNWNPWNCKDHTRRRVQNVTHWCSNNRVTSLNYHQHACTKIHSINQQTYSKCSKSLYTIFLHVNVVVILEMEKNKARLKFYFNDMIHRSFVLFPK